MTCVVKIGGSLCDDPWLPRWLSLLAEAGGGRVVIVPGGGRFAEQARAAHARWSLDDVAAHNLAVLGMAQYAMLMHGLCGALKPARTRASIRAALAGGRVALWIPLEVLRRRADALTSWDVTSDSLAAWLARRLDAKRLVLVKSCRIPHRATLVDCAAAGIVDRSLGAFVRHAGYAVDVVEKRQLARMRDFLQGAHAAPPGARPAAA